MSHDHNEEKFNCCSIKVFFKIRKYQIWECLFFSLSHNHLLSLSHTHPLSLSLSDTHMHTLFLSHRHTHLLSLTHTYAHPLFLTHTCTPSIHIQWNQPHITHPRNPPNSNDKRKLLFIILFNFDKVKFEPGRKWKIFPEGDNTKKS